MDLLTAATPHAHGARPSSRNPTDLSGLHEQLAVVKVRTISPPDSDLDTAHAAERRTIGNHPLPYFFTDRYELGILCPEVAGSLRVRRDRPAEKGIGRPGDRVLAPTSGCFA
jgi:hypothetical protein